MGGGRCRVSSSWQSCMAARARAVRGLVRTRASKRMENAGGGGRTSPPPPCPWMIVGLGNPGAHYARTRHNVGFLVLEALARKHGVPMGFDAGSNALIGKGTMHGVAVLLVQPQTYMNESGKAVRKLANYYKVRPEYMLAVYDDLDLDVAKLRLRGKGGHGGHNGMRSIIDCLGGRKDFPRLKIGIGRPRGSLPVHAHVLQPFLPEEQEEINVSIMESIGLVESLVTNGLEQTVSKMNPTKKKEKTNTPPRSPKVPDTPPMGDNQDVQVR
mmetsp:Transcript_7622/g.47026  ORF Transcript_7622/g.47026 Transcript_7622/m.47026 type:complete len:270 (-) Transcript_7622:3303-4112(-)